MRVEKITSGFYEVEERGYLYTITRIELPASGAPGWKITRIEHSEFWVRNVLSFEQALHVVLDDATMHYRVDVIRDLAQAEMVVMP
jgi:hypothetical protein